MTPFEDWITDELSRAEREARDSHKLSMNSYGAGYDAGYVAALKVVAERMTPELAGVLINQ